MSGKHYLIIRGASFTSSSLAKALLACGDAVVNRGQGGEPASCTHPA